MRVDDKAGLMSWRLLQLRGYDRPKPWELWISYWDSIFIDVLQAT